MQPRSIDDSRLGAVRPERRDARERVEIPILVQEIEVVAHCAGGDHAIHARPHRQARPPRRSVEIRRVVENGTRHRRFDGGKRVHGLSRRKERALIVESL